jgi:hypothetical protein
MAAVSQAEWDTVLMRNPPQVMGHNPVGVAQDVALVAAQEDSAMVAADLLDVS